MAYVSDSNLTQFWGLAKDHINAEDGRFANWQKTEKAGVVTCWPVGGTPLLPTVDFLFTEAGPASGDKAPDNPSTITGVSSITVTRCETVGVDSADYVIDLGGTYYGGSIDLSTGLMTVTHFVAYIDSSATFVVYEKKTNTVALVATLTSQTTIPNNGEAIAQNSSCDYFPCSVYNDDTEHIRAVSYVSRQFRIFISYSTLGLTSEATNEQIIAAAASWFTNHPATLVLGLTAASWYTVQLTPQQLKALPALDRHSPRINTLYTDADSIQVSYQKSPIQTEREITDAILALGSGLGI